LRASHFQQIIFFCNIFKYMDNSIWQFSYLRDMLHCLIMVKMWDVKNSELKDTGISSLSLEWNDFQNLSIYLFISGNFHWQNITILLFTILDNIDQWFLIFKKINEHFLALITFKHFVTFHQNHGLCAVLM